MGEGGNTLIYDWQAPICNMFKFEMGRAYYEAMGQRFEGSLVSFKELPAAVNFISLPFQQFCRSLDFEFITFYYALW